MNKMDQDKIIEEVSRLSYLIMSTAKLDLAIIKKHIEQTKVDIEKYDTNDPGDTIFIALKEQTECLEKFIPELELFKQASIEYIDGKTEVYGEVPKGAIISPPGTC